MIKIFFPGNRKRKDWRKSASSAYAFFVSAGILCVISLFLASLLALYRGKIVRLERDSETFYKSLENENSSLIRDWGEVTGEIINEND